MPDSQGPKTMVNKIERNYTYSLIGSDGTRIQVIEKATVGRGKNNDIKILHKKISRNHAILTISNNSLQIKDLESSNGTSVNNEFISTTVTLVHGDIVKFDDVPYTVDISFVSEEDRHAEKQPQQVVIEPKSENQDGPAEEDIPDSWIEESTTAINGTRMMNLAQLEALKSSEKMTTTNESNTHQLHCFIGDADERIIKLELNTDEGPQVWEIGRSAVCDIRLKHPSVSKKHAQLIHHKGRWKVVNLVSTNGILINGQKKLSAFLSANDKIVLGSTSLVFQTPKSDAAHQSVKTTTKMKPLILIIISVAIISAVIVWKYYSQG